MKKFKIKTKPSPTWEKGEKRIRAPRWVKFFRHLPLSAVFVNHYSRPFDIKTEFKEMDRLILILLLLTVSATTILCWMLFMIIVPCTAT